MRLRREAAIASRGHCRELAFAKAAVRPVPELTGEKVLDDGRVRTRVAYEVPGLSRRDTDTVMVLAYSRGAVVESVDVVYQTYSRGGHARYLRLNGAIIGKTEIRRGARSANLTSHFDDLTLVEWDLERGIPVRGGRCVRFAALDVIGRWPR